MEEIHIIKKEQARVAELVIIRDDFSNLDYIAGVDSIVINNEKIIAVIILCNKEMEPIDKAFAIHDKKNNQSDWQAAYKEGPAIIEAVKKLKTKPDVILVNGHGISHSRLGIASFIGLLLDTSTIGVVKNIVHGKVVDGLLYVENEIRGYELQTRKGSRPVYVSPGHKVSLKSSINIVRDCIKWPHKLPEPLALAHKYLNKLKKEEIESNS